MFELQFILRYIVGIGGILAGGGSLLIRYTVMTAAVFGVLTNVTSDTLAALPDVDTSLSILMWGLAAFGYSGVKIAEMAQAEKLILETRRVANVSVDSPESAKKPSYPRAPTSHDLGS